MSSLPGSGSARSSVTSGRLLVGMLVLASIALLVVSLRLSDYRTRTHDKETALVAARQHIEAQREKEMQLRELRDRQKQQMLELKARIDDLLSENDRAAQALRDQQERADGFKTELRHLQNSVLPPRRQADAGNVQVISGEVLDVSVFPSLAAADYPDAISVVKVRPLQSVIGRINEPEILVGDWVLHRRKVLPAAATAVGDVRRFQLYKPETLPPAVSRVRSFDSLGEFELPFYIASLEQQIRLARLAEEPSRRDSIGALETAIQERRAALGFDSWDDWHRSLREYRDQLQSISSDGQWGINLPTLAYLRVEDLSVAVPDGLPPAEVIVDFANQLEARGIDFIYMSVPCKAEVYPDKFGPAASSDLIAPQREEFMAALCDAGVEVMDALPPLMAMRAGTEGGVEAPFLRFDPHLSPQGARLVGEMIGARLERYLDDDDDRLPYSITSREVDLPFDESIDLPHQKSVNISQVNQPDGGGVYQDTEDSPLLILGDSNTFYWQDTKSGGAGISAHAARRSGRPVSRFSQAGFLPHNLARMDNRKLLEGRRCVVMVQTVWVLWDLRSPWKRFELDWGSPYGEP